MSSCAKARSSGKGAAVLILLAVGISAVEGGQRIAQEGASDRYGESAVDMNPHLELGINRPMHSMWGERELDESGRYAELPPGHNLQISASQLRQVYDLNTDPLVNALEDGLTEGEGIAQQAVTRAARAAGVFQPDEEHKHTAAPGSPRHKSQHRSRSRATLPPEGRPLSGQVLSPLGQQEQGVNPRGQPCPSYGLDHTEFLVVGGTQHYWRKSVEIQDLDGKILGTVRRGCPAWTDSFVWRVPAEHASGCRDHVDPNVFTSICQVPEVEVLYTDEWSGLQHMNEIKIRDCHDDLIFRLYEEKKEIIIHDYMIHSDFVVESRNKTIMGYCRQDRLPGRSLARVGDHNFSIVDMDGETVASATRPFHWPNGATSHVWHVSIVQESVPGTISDMRVVAVAVLNNVLLHEQDDWCSDIVYMLTPILLTMLGIAIIIVISTCVSCFQTSSWGKKLSDAETKTS